MSKGKRCLIFQLKENTGFTFIDDMMLAPFSTDVILTSLSEASSQIHLETFYLLSQLTLDQVKLIHKLFITKKAMKKRKGVDMITVIGVITVIWAL